VFCVVVVVVVFCYVVFCVVVVAVVVLCCVVDLIIERNVALFIGSMTSHVELVTALIVAEPEQRQTVD